MKSEETWIGMRVKVSPEHRRTDLRGMEGTIVQSYGDLSYLALDVQLDNGRSELFWHHELGETESVQKRRWE